jgi:hypothetical protein
VALRYRPPQQMDVKMGLIVLVVTLLVIMPALLYASGVFARRVLQRRR